jgi:hypothetical protein
MQEEESSEASTKQAGLQPRISSSVLLKHHLKLREALKEYFRLEDRQFIDLNILNGVNTRSRLHKALRMENSMMIGVLRLHLSLTHVRK